MIRLLLFGIVACLGLMAQPQAGGANAANEAGVEHLRRSEFIDAIAAFRKAVEIDPKLVRAWNNLGSALAQAGDMQDSVDAFKRAVALSPEDLQLRMNLGIALRAMGDADAALEQFRLVARERASDPEVHQQLGLAFKQQGNLAAATEAFETVLTYNPENREAYYNLATVLRQQAAAVRKRQPQTASSPQAERRIAEARQALSRGDLAGARGGLESLLKEAPSSAEALNLLGFVQGQQKNLPASILTLTRAVELAPDLADAHYNLGVARWYAGHRAKSVESLEKAVQLNPAAPEVYAFLGMARREMGDLENSRRALQRALALGPSSPAPYIDLGLVFLRQGQHERAVGQFEAALNLPSPTGPIPDLDLVITELRAVLSRTPSAEGRNVLGLLLGKQGADPRVVAAEFREAIRLQPTYAQAHNNLGLVLLQAGDQEKGLAELKEALRHAPEYPDALGNLGAALVPSEPEEAIRLLQKAVSLQPAFVRAHYNLALAYAQSPKFGIDQAIAQFRKVVDLAPGFSAARFEFGKVLFRRNELKEAIAQFREALRLEPTLGAAQYQLGLALTRAGQKEEGARHIEQARAAIDRERKLTIAGQLMGEARAAMDAGKTESAADSLQQLLQLLPDYTPARDALQRLGAKSGPSDDPAKVRLFEDHIRNQRFAELEPLVVEYLTQNPNSWWAHYVLGYVRFGQRRIGDSITSVAKSLELNVNNADAHRLLGRTLMIIGRYDVARTELELAAKLRPEWPEVRYDLGKVHSASDNYALARRELEEALRLDPNYMEAYEALGFVMEALSDDPAAVRYYKKAAEIRETRQARFVAPYVSLASLYNRTGEPKLAAEYARKAIEIDGSSDSALFQLAKALDRLQQWPDAVTALKRAVDTNPNIASYHYVLSGLYRRLGQAAESQQHMETFRRLEKEAAEFERKRREAQRAASGATAAASPAKAPSPQ